MYFCSQKCQNKAANENLAAKYSIPSMIVAMGDELLEEGKALAIESNMPFYAINTQTGIILVVEKSLK